MRDSYTYSRHVAKRILFYLKGKSFLSFSDFKQKVSHWIDVFQVEQQFKREAFFAAFLSYYKRPMNQVEEKELCKLYPVSEEKILQKIMDERYTYSDVKETIASMKGKT